jgi:hypothetical protein
MSKKDDPHKFLDFSRHQLKGDANELDPDTREKLMQMKHRALESSLEGKNNFPDWASLPIIGFITALIFVSLVYLKPDLKSRTDNGLEDLEILISSDPIDFYENLEFLQKWKMPENETKVK